MPEITLRQAVERLQQECNKYESCSRDCPYYIKDESSCSFNNPWNMMLPEDNE